MKKKLLSIFMVLSLVLSMTAALSITAFANDGGPNPTELKCSIGDEVEWFINDGKLDRQIDYLVKSIKKIEGDLPDGMELKLDKDDGKLFLKGTPIKLGLFKSDIELECYYPNSNEIFTDEIRLFVTVDDGSITLPTYEETLYAGKERNIRFDMGCSGYITDGVVVSGALPSGMTGDQDWNYLYVLGTPNKSGIYSFVISCTDSLNGCTVYQPCTITVKGDLAPVITKQPTGESIYEGGSTCFIAKADNYTGITWRFVSKDTKTVINASDASSYFAGLKVTGYNGVQLNISNAPLALNGWSAECKFDGPGGTTYSNGAIIGVSKPPLQIPEITSNPANANINPGESVTLSLGANSPDGNELTFQWYKTVKNGNYGGEAIPNAIGSTLKVSYEEGLHYYYCVVYNNRDGEISAPVASSVAAVTGVIPITPTPTPAPTPAPSAEPEATPAPANTPAPSTPAPVPTAVPAAPVTEKADHTTGIIVGAVLCVAIICGTVIFLQKGKRR